MRHKVEILDLTFKTIKELDDIETEEIGEAIEDLFFDYFNEKFGSIEEDVTFDTSTYGTNGEEFGLIYLEESVVAYYTVSKGN